MGRLAVQAEKTADRARPVRPGSLQADPRRITAREADHVAGLQSNGLLVEPPSPPFALTLDLDLNDRVVDMVADRIDIAVRVTTTPPTLFVARRVGTVRLIFCASREYLEKRRVPRAPAELAEHACLVLSGQGAPDVWQFGPGTPAGSPETVRVKPRLLANNTFALLDGVRAGLGIAELPEYLVEDDLRARRLVRLLEPFKVDERGAFVVYPAGRLLPARVKEAAKYLTRELGKRLPP